MPPENELTEDARFGNIGLAGYALIEWVGGFDLTRQPEFALVLMLIVGFGTNTCNASGNPILQGSCRVRCAAA